MDSAARRRRPRAGARYAWGATQLERHLRDFRHVRGEHSRVSGQRLGGEPDRPRRVIADPRVLIRAGLVDEPDVRPASVAGVGRRPDPRGDRRIEEVARRLGMRSLDRAARLIGWDWADGDSRGSVAAESASALETGRGARREPGPLRARRTDPRAGPNRGGRPRQYPAFMWLVFEALRQRFGSARQVEAELAHPIVWDSFRAPSRAEPVPDGSVPVAARAPMRRHHYLYSPQPVPHRPDCLAELAELHRDLAADQARKLGLLDPDGPGSWTHPDLSRMLHADGKVITPLFRARPGDRKLDTATGELRPVRAEPDGPPRRRRRRDGVGHQVRPRRRPHARRPRPHHPRRRVGPDRRRRSRTAMDCFTRLAPLVPGAQGVIYDTALRGVHHQTLLRELGLLPINRVTAAKANPKHPAHERNDASRRAPISKTAPSPADGQPVDDRALRRGGAVGIGELTETGDLTFTELPRIRTHRNPTRTGGSAGTTTTNSPAATADGTITVRLHANDDDTGAASSTAPRTSDRSRRPTRTSPGSTRAATTPSPSTATSKTPSGSDAPTASATPASTSTSSATHSWSTASPSTATSDAAPSSPPSRLEPRAPRTLRPRATARPEAARERQRRAPSETADRAARGTARLLPSARSARFSSR